jgi:hypothetical protein
MMFNQIALRRIYELVGEAATTWNQVENLWYLMFTVLMAETDRDKTDAIYDMFQTGAMQRQLFMRVAPIALKYDVDELRLRNPEHHTRRRILKRVGQLNAKTNDLAGKRNAVIHTGFEDWGSRIVAMSPHKASKLRDEDYLRYLNELVEDSTLLVIDLADLRDMFLDWHQPGAREGRLEIMRKAGFRALEDERKAERARLLLAVAQRKPLPPLPSEG